MKVSITGASDWIKRLFEACGNYQWAREFVANSLEASATRIEFGIEWQAVEKLGVYRRTIADNGCGMDRQELLRFFSTLGIGAKKIGGVHEHFGVGAKIASLPWNPEGLVVISYKGSQASMIWMVLDDDSGDFELVEFKTPDGGSQCVVEPPLSLDGVNWSAIRPEWIKDHGTVIVLLGSTEYPDTVLGNPHAGEKEIKGLSVYLNTRFWDLSGVEVRVVELRSEKKAQWPTGPGDRDDSRRPNNRQIMGARHWLDMNTASKGRLGASDVLAVDGDRVLAEWYLWDGERPAIDSYAKKGGYIAVRYNGELFQLTTHKAHFRWFGIVESKVQQNLTIILEPQLYQAANGRWGIHPDQSRNRLIFTGNGEKGVEPPISDWGTEFVAKLPDPIREAIRAARGELNGTIEDEDYRKRLQDKFGDRWSMKVLVKPRDTDRDRRPAAPSDDSIEVFEDRQPSGVATERKRKKTVKVIRKKASPDGSEEGVERDAPVDVPRYRFARKEEFEAEWHVALWAPNDPEGPTVVINSDSQILQEIVEHHQAQYPDVHAEEVGITIRGVFGEIAACKIAHSQKLSRKVPREQLDREYRSEQALTIALMGLLAEEAVISQRLGKLGRKKPAA